LIARYRPLTAGFAFYGAARSVYSHVVARGREVVFPKNTPMDIRFGTHQGPAKAGVGAGSTVQPVEAARNRMQ
jgi:hypothetical protein